MKHSTRNTQEIIVKKKKNSQRRPAGDQTKRTCLRCQKVFVSTGPGNRICQKCHRVSNEYVKDTVSAGAVRRKVKQNSY